MTIFKTKLDTIYQDFLDKGHLDRTLPQKFTPNAIKRIGYYCESRKFIEDVFGIRWDSGLNLHKLLTSKYELHILSEHPNPAEDVYAGGRQQYHFVFCAVSPLLQRFIAFRLWPEQIPRARDLIVELRRIIEQGSIPLVQVSGSIGLYWPHNDLKLQRGEACILEKQSPDKALQKIMLIPGLHHCTPDLTWWRGLSDYSTFYIAKDESSRFMCGGICIVKLDQKLTDHCQFRILNLNGTWSNQIYKFSFAGSRGQNALGHAGEMYSILYLREYNDTTGDDRFWIQDAVKADYLDILLHLLMRQFHSFYLENGRLKIASMDKIQEIVKDSLYRISRMRLGLQTGEFGLKIGFPLIVKFLLDGYFRIIDNSLYFIPPTMNDEPDISLKMLDSQLALLEGKSKQTRDFFKEFLQDGDEALKDVLGDKELLKTIFVTWLMTRINYGMRPWIPEKLGMLSISE